MTDRGERVIRLPPMIPCQGRGEAGHETNLNPDSYFQQKSVLTGGMQTE